MKTFPHQTAVKPLSRARGRGWGGGLVILLLLLTFAVRVHNLEVQSLWNDEGNSYVQATRTLPEIAANAARDIHPPGYYALLGGWQLLAGESEFALRFPSTLTLVLASTFLYAIGRRLFGMGAGVLAVAFTALNTFSIYYAQEARMYALLTLCVAALFWSIIRLLERPTRQRAVVLGVVTVAGLYTQYAFPFFMLAGGLVVVGFAVSQWRAGDESVSTRILWRPVIAFIAANGFAFLLYLPWLPEAIRQITTWPNTGVATPPGEAFAVIIRWLTFGITGEGATMAIPFILLVFGLIRLRQLSSTVVSRQTDSKNAVPTRDAIWPILVPVLWVAVPLLIFLVMGLFRPANLKFLLPAQLGMALWLARGVVVLWRGARGGLLRLRNPEVIPQVGVFLRLAGAGAAAWLVFTQLQLLPPLYSDPRYQRADYRAIAARIRDELGTGDAVILNAPNQVEVFGYYYGRSPEDTASVYGIPAGLGGSDQEILDQILSVWSQDSVGKKLYILFWGEAERDPNRFVERHTDMFSFYVDDTWYGDVRLARYAFPVNRELVMPPYDLQTLNPQTTFSNEQDAITLISYTLQKGELLVENTIRAELIWMVSEAPERPYKIFLQLLSPDGTLALQSDSEPAGGVELPLAVVWRPEIIVSDKRALILPENLAPGEYTLITGIYPADNPAARLRLPDGRDYLELARITIPTGEVTVSTQP